MLKCLFFLFLAYPVHAGEVNVFVNWTLSCLRHGDYFMYEVRVFESDLFNSDDFVGRREGGGYRLATGEMAATHSGDDAGNHLEFYMQIRLNCTGVWNGVRRELQPECWEAYGNCVYINKYVLLD